jgi:hypothetical protein
MLTKLILLLIFLNLAGGFFKRFQANRRRREAMLYGEKPPPTPQVEEPPESPQIMTEPEDLFASLMEKWGEPKSEPAREPEPLPPPAPVRRPFYAEPAAVTTEPAVTEETPATPAVMAVPETLEAAKKPRSLFTRGSLRQAVIYHEVLGTPKGLQ